MAYSPAGLASLRCMLAVEMSVVSFGFIRYDVSKYLQEVRRGEVGEFGTASRWNLRRDGSLLTSQEASPEPSDAED
tara:strand:+ start:452 stop:679 length:228 start_codon:yes stop_codon:yes gene_type:complete